MVSGVSRGVRNVRQCKSCGLPEERRMVDGHPQLNLDPTTGLCVSCLVQSKGGLQAMPGDPRDWQKAAAKDED